MKPPKITLSILFILFCFYALGYARGEYIGVSTWDTQRQDIIDDKNLECELKIERQLNGINNLK